jgi:putative ABC transport system permease protein
LLTWRATIPNPFRHSRVFASILAIAAGVALGFAVYLVNRVAVDEFASAVRQLSGTADFVVEGPRLGFDERVYAATARLPDIASASPVVDVRATLPGKKESLKILGVDLFRTAEIHPDWIPPSGTAAKLFEPDTIAISAAAATKFSVKRGDRLLAQVGLAAIDLEVIDVLTGRENQEAFALMDIANAQQRFERLGTISRIELRARPGANVATLREAITALLPVGVSMESPAISAASSADLSKAYRVNMRILALVALFTGVFLVFSTQALAVVRRRPQLALVRVLGVSRRRMIAYLLLEGAAIGACGALLGVVCGYALASFTLRSVGADLGAGYFPGVTPTLQLSTAPTIAFIFLGIAVAVIGTLVPALEAGATPPAPALRSGSQEIPLRNWAQPRAGLICFALALVALYLPLPTVLPLGGYVAIALILAGALMLLPTIAKISFSLIRPSKNIAGHLAVEHLRNAYGHVAMSVAALFVSFTLIVAMGIMVFSFRASVIDWLDAVMPADIYVRSGQAGDSSFFDTTNQHVIAAISGIAEVGFVRFQNIVLTPGQPAVALIARSVDTLTRHRALPLVGATHQRKASDPPPIWISEAIRDLHRFDVGQVMHVPIAGNPQPFIVVGVWRDYARQFGALLIDRTDYIRITGDSKANDAALFLKPGVRADDVINALRQVIVHRDQLEFTTAREVRKISLQIFDRSFYVTYVLEFMTVLIGLFGVSASFSASLLMRRKEFGMLRHIGLTRRKIAQALALEGAWIGVLGTLLGAIAGFFLSLILIHVVTRQSFHWSMDVHIPWRWLALLETGLIAATALTAWFSARQAMGEDAIIAVREDW